MNLVSKDVRREDSLLTIQTSMKLIGMGGFMTKTAKLQVSEGCKALAELYAVHDENYYVCDRYEHEKLKIGLLRCANLIAGNVIKGTVGREFEQQLQKQVGATLKHIAVSSRKKEKEMYDEE